MGRDCGIQVRYVKILHWQTILIEGNANGWDLLKYDPQQENGPKPGPFQTVVKLDEKRVLSTFFSLYKFGR